MKKNTVCYTAKSLLDEVEHSSINGSVEVGFVPTMGALHSGHIQLVKKACIENQLVVVSIIVNPTQFTVKKDQQNIQMVQLDVH